MVHRVHQPLLLTTCSTCAIPVRGLGLSIITFCLTYTTTPEPSPPSASLLLHLCLTTLTPSASPPSHSLPHHPLSHQLLHLNHHHPLPHHPHTLCLTTLTPSASPPSSSPTTTTEPWSALNTNQSESKHDVINMFIILYPNEGEGISFKQ
ncbi:hypothetical protein Pcinc_034952 [Petrolisthes cinctipes]|uniref:Uncharacterized protein n=1 Tax=Petrolisthes cinctipes TaxID=88211 RepID=A0AAE1ENE9_PETCI|nr:hypothetical protein Pcinc_034952 [Petrolisthes cinctipes]